MSIPVLGETVQRGDQPYRVVRVIKESVTLYEPDEGTAPPYIVTESYIELKGADGNIEFEVVASVQTTYVGEPSTIKACTPISWRKK